MAVARILKAGEHQLDREPALSYSIPIIGACSYPCLRLCLMSTSCRQPGDECRNKNNETIHITSVYCLTKKHTHLKPWREQVPCKVRSEHSLLLRCHVMENRMLI